MNVQHQNPRSQEYDDVLEELLKKNKYLRLAFWLEKNRGDWSDGCHYARTGLRDFVATSDIDGEIVAELQEICDDFEDGRSFRDCTWNYGRLLQMAEHDAPELVADYKKLREFYTDQEELYW